MAPTLVNSYLTSITALNLTSLVSTSFTPNVGELIVVKAATADAATTVGTPSASGFTLGTVTSRVNNGVSGSSTKTALFTASVTASAAGTITLTVAGSALPHMMVVERWSSAQLAGSPVVANTTTDATSPWTTAITTAAANSVISYICADWAAVSTAGVAFSGDTATPTQEQTAINVSGQYSVYMLYQAAASAGSNTIGLSAPSGMTLNTAGIEIQDSGGVAAAPLPALKYRQYPFTYEPHHARAAFGGLG